MKIAIERTDGGVEVMTLIGGADAATEVAKWQAHYPGKYVSHREVADNVIPTDRSKRNAWRPDFTIDPTKVVAPPKSATELLTELLVSKNLITAGEADDIKGKKK